MAGIPVAVSAKRPGKLVQLQILRAVAASLVVLNHGIVELASEGVLSSARYEMAANLVGHYGVSAFFTLSGFIMTRQAWRRFQEPGASGSFLLERLVRIAPLYWIATILTYWKLMNAYPTLHIKGQLGLSLAFIPNFLADSPRMFPLLVQGWTLNYEMLFYLALALCLLLPRRWGLTVLVGAMGLLALAGRASWMQLHGWILAFYCTPLLRLFVAGVVLAVLTSKGRGVGKVGWWVPAWVLVCLPAAVALSLAGWSQLASCWVWAQLLGAIAVIICLCARDRNSGRVQGALAKLGDASYSTYLFHVFVVSQVAYWAGLVRMPAWLVLVLMVAASNAFGLVLHYVVERPMTRWLKRVMLPTQGSAGIRPRRA